jgi:hypothetical protein
MASDILRLSKLEAPQNHVPPIPSNSFTVIGGKYAQPWTDDAVTVLDELDGGCS